MYSRHRNHNKFPSEADAFGEEESSRYVFDSAASTTPPSIASSSSTIRGSSHSVTIDHSAILFDGSRSEFRKSVSKVPASGVGRKRTTFLGTVRLSVAFLIIINIFATIYGFRWILGLEQAPNPDSEKSVLAEVEGEASFKRFSSAHAQKNPNFSENLSPSSLGYLVVPGLTDPAIVAAAMYEEMKRIGQPVGEEAKESLLGPQNNDDMPLQLLYPIGKVRAYVEEEPSSLRADAAGSVPPANNDATRLKIDVVYTYVDPLAPSFRKAMRTRRLRGLGLKSVSTTPTTKASKQDTEASTTVGTFTSSSTTISSPAPTSTADPSLHSLPTRFCSNPNNDNSPQAANTRKLWDTLTPSLALNGRSGRRDAEEDRHTNEKLRNLADRFRSAEKAIEGLEMAIKIEEELHLSTSTSTSTTTITSTTTTTTSTTTKTPLDGSIEDDDFEEIMHHAQDINRYRNFNEILHSLRGVYYHLIGGRKPSSSTSDTTNTEDPAPLDESTIGKIFIVVSDKDQVPAWLRNRGGDEMLPNEPYLRFYKEKIVIVEHAEIFPQPHDTILPTFNSYAIESQIHRIPNLSRHYFYFNNDMLLARPVSFFDYFQPFVVDPKITGQRPVVRWLPTIMPDSIQPVTCMRGSSGRNCKTNTDELLDRQVGLMRDAFVSNGKNSGGGNIGSSVTLYYSHLPHLIDRHIMQELMEGLKEPEQKEDKNEPLPPPNDVDATKKGRAGLSSADSDDKNADITNINNNTRGGLSLSKVAAGLSLVASRVKDMLLGFGPVAQSEIGGVDYIRYRTRHLNRHGSANKNFEAAQEEREVSTTTKPPPERRALVNDGKRHSNIDVFPTMLYMHYSLAHRFGRDYQKAAVATGGGGGGFGSVSGKIMLELYEPLVAHVSRRRGGGYSIEATEADTSNDDMVAGTKGFNFPPSLFKKIEWRDSYGASTTFIDSWGRERTTIFSYFIRLVREEKQRWMEETSSKGNSAKQIQAHALPRTSTLIIQTLLRMVKDLHMVTTPEGKALLMEEQIKQRDREALRALEEQRRWIGDRGRSGQGRPPSFRQEPPGRKSANAPEGTFEMLLPIHFISFERPKDDTTLETIGGAISGLAHAQSSMHLALQRNVINTTGASSQGLLFPLAIAKDGSQLYFSPYTAADRSILSNQGSINPADGSSASGTSLVSYSFPSKSVPVFRTLNREGSYDHWLLDYFTLLSANVFPQSSSLRYYFSMMKGGKGQGAKVLADVTPRQGKVLFLTINDDMSSTPAGAISNNNYRRRSNEEFREERDRAYQEARAHRAAGFVGVNRDRVDQMIRERAEQQSLRRGVRGRGNNQVEVDRSNYNDQSSQLNTKDTLTLKLLELVPYPMALFIASGGQGALSTSTSSASSQLTDTFLLNESSAFEHLIRQVQEQDINTPLNAAPTSMEPFDRQIWACVPHHIKELARVVLQSSQVGKYDAFEREASDKDKSGADDMWIANSFSKKIQKIFTAAVLDYKAAISEHKIPLLELRLKDMHAARYKQSMENSSSVIDSKQPPASTTSLPTTTPHKPILPPDYHTPTIPIPEGGADLIKIYELFAPRHPAAWESRK